MPVVPPQVTSISFDQARYEPGDVVTATVTYVPGYPQAPAAQVTASALDEVTGLAGQAGSGFTVAAPDVTTVTLADTGGRTWVKVSDTGTVAVFTSTA